MEKIKNNGKKMQITLPIGTYKNMEDFCQTNGYKKAFFISLAIEAYLKNFEKIEVISKGLKYEKR